MFALCGSATANMNGHLFDGPTERPMTAIRYLSPKDEIPVERHVAVIVHRGFGGMEQDYFFDSAKGDNGGSAGFD